VFQVSEFFGRVGASLGPNWTNALNGFATNSNAQGTSASGSHFNAAAYAAVIFTPDQSVTVVIGSLNGTTDAIGPAVRIQGAGTGTASYYVAEESSTTLYLQKVVGATSSSGGTVTTLASVAVAGAAGDVITITVIGNTLTVDWNGTKDILQATDASSPITSGQPGIHQFNNTATFSSLSSGFTVPTFSATSYDSPANTMLNIVCDGDSITAGYGIVTPWTSSLLVSGSKVLISIANLGVPSKCLGVTNTAQHSIQSMIATAPTSVDSIFLPGIRNIVVAWGGTNDIGDMGRTISQVYADLQTYCAARHAAGFKVIVVPMLSRVTIDPQIQAYNALLAGNSSFADGLVSLPPSLVGPGAYANPILFQTGGVHPTQVAATTIIAPAISASINNLLAGGVPIGALAGIMAGAASER
jgi:hypothetical protein